MLREKRFFLYHRLTAPGSRGSRMPCPHVRTVPTGHSFHPERDWLARFAPVDLWISISLSLALMAQERLTTNRHGLLWAAPLEAALPLFGFKIRERQRFTNVSIDRTSTARPGVGGIGEKWFSIRFPPNLPAPNTAGFGGLWPAGGGGARLFAVGLTS